VGLAGHWSCLWVANDYFLLAPVLFYKY
jgi:hypothetical protein